MKKSHKILMMLLALGLVVPSVAFAAYVIHSDANIGNVDEVVDQQHTDGFKQVTFKNTDGSVLDSVYLAPNESINSSNTPLLGAKHIKWVEDIPGGAAKLDLCDENLKSYTPSQDVVLKATEVAASTTVGNSITNNVNTGNPNNPNGNTTTVITNNSISLKENPTISDKTKVCNDVQIGGALDKVNVNASYRGVDSSGNVVDRVENDILAKQGGNFVNQANGDYIIGLDDPTEPVSMYKPNAGHVYVVDDQHPQVNNYCVSKITLKADLIITNAALEIGAMQGFYGNNDGWSQHHFQGFITGNYSELDLNGHNLIMGSGSTLTAYGSITNSVPGSGKVILESGSHMLATCVVEEHNCERALPVQYYNGGELFPNIKMPYLNCDLLIKQGADFKASLMLDFGGNRDVCIHEKLPFIGPNNTYIFQMESTNGYVLRKSYFDENAYNLSASRTFIRQNLIHQRVDYEFHDITTLTLNNKTIRVSFTIANFDLDLAKNGFLIPRYFRIFLYNTRFNNNKYLTFLPGSYLFVDEQSSIHLYSSNYYKFSAPALVGSMHGYYYMNVGGLNFASECYSLDEAYKNPGYKANAVGENGGSWGWMDDGETKGFGTNGGFISIRKSAQSFMYYLNKEKPAHADILGQITFAPINNFNGNSLHYQLGGEINIKNIEQFKNNVSASSQYIDLFAAGCFFGTCYAEGTTLNNMTTNITDYYVAPLVSNGNVLMDPNSQNVVRSDYASNLATYDKYTGIVSYSSTNKKYAFIHTLDNVNWNGSFETLKKNKHKKIHQFGEINEDKQFKRGYEQGQDDFKGKFFEVQYNENTHIATTPISLGASKNFIFFRGAMMPYSNGLVDIDKFTGQSSNLLGGFERNSKGDLITKNTKALGNKRTVQYLNDNNYGHYLWKLA